MSRKPTFLSPIISLVALALSLVSAANVIAQTPCADLNTATGQPGWMLVSGPGISSPRVPVSVSPYPGWKNPPLPGSSWVSLDANHGSMPGAAGDYTYEFTFCLCKAGQHTLNLSYYADNGATVFLNTTQIDATTGSSNFTGSPRVKNYTWSGGLGTNKLRIVVRNNEGPTGLNAILRINGATVGACCQDLSTTTGRPGWMLTSGPGVTMPRLPVNVSPYPGWKNPPLPGSSWVSIDANHGRVPGLAGQYTYEFTFCLCKEGKHNLSLSYYADNGATVFLNSTQISATTGGTNFNGTPTVVNYNWVGGPGTSKVRIVVRNDGGPTGLNAVLKVTGASERGCKETTSDPGSVSGRVVDQRNAPVSNVEVSVPGRSAVLTDSKGQFEIANLQPTQRLAVSFSAAGFMNTTRIYQVGKSAGNGTTVVIWPRAKPVSLDGARGGKVRFAAGGGVTIPANSLVDSSGRPVSGTVMVSLTQLDVSDRAQLRTMAGDFQARMADGSPRMLESFGLFELVATDARGGRVNLARGRTARFDLPIPRTLKRRVPKLSGLYSFDTASGLWIENGQVTLTDELVYNGTIDNFDGSLWNTDNPVQVTCITVKFVDVFGANSGPIANALVTATGINYNAISSGFTNDDGLVCLLVKINSAIQIEAVDPILNTVIGPITVTSPNTVSGAADCGNPTLCPLVMTMEQDARWVVPSADKTMTAHSAFPQFKLRSGAFSITNPLRFSEARVLAADGGIEPKGWR